ncbi:MAG: lectin-like protein [Bacteroidota bacterium]
MNLRLPGFILIFCLQFLQFLSPFEAIAFRGKESADFFSASSKSIKGLKAGKFNVPPFAPLNPLGELNARANGPLPAGQVLRLYADTIIEGSFEWFGPNGFYAIGRNQVINPVTKLHEGQYIVVATYVSGEIRDTVNVTITCPWVPGVFIDQANVFFPGHTFNGNKYFVSRRRESWGRARHICDSAGGHMASITSEEERAFVAQLIDNEAVQTAWLGATDSLQEGDWQWVTGEPFTYMNWNEGEPNDLASASCRNEGEDFLTMYYANGKWNDLDSWRCNQLPYVLEVENAVAGMANGNGPVLFGDSLRLTAASMAGATFSWFGPNGFTSSEQNPVIYPSTALNSGLYLLTVNYYGCTANDAVWLEVKCPKYNAALPGHSLLTSVGKLKYYISDIPLNHRRADSAARATGGRLACLKTQTIQDSIYAALFRLGNRWLFGQSGPWIGLSDSAGTNAWQWADGSVPAYTNWRPGEPNNIANDHYADITIDGQWNNLDSSLELYWITERKPNAILIKGPNTAIAGQSLNLNTDSVPGNTYTWTGPGGFVAAGKTMQLNPVLSSSAGRYILAANNFGCITYDTLVLTVNCSPDTHALNATFCSGTPYSFGWRMLYSLGTYTDTLTNRFGCDSIRILHLRQLSTNATVINASVCRGSIYTFNSATGVMQLNSGGTYTTIFPNASGCDSSITLNLSIINNNIDEHVATICEGGQYSFRGNFYSEPGTYSDTLTNAAGCDSIIRLTLLVKSPARYFTTRYICAGDSTVFRDSVFYQGGIYPFITPDVSGCDSIVATLTVVPDTLKPVVRRVGNALICSWPTPPFQWYLNNVLIPGATNSGISAIAEGNYTVSVLSQNIGCLVFSEPFPILLGLEKGVNHAAWKLYPNPTESQLYLQGVESNEEAEICDMQGRIIWSGVINTGSIATTDLVPGLYSLRIMGRGAQLFMKK